MRTRLRIPLAIALGGTLACGDSANAPEAGGAPGTLEGPDIMLTATTEHVYTAGAYMGEDWESFSLPVDVAFDGAGNAHIVDMQAHRATVPYRPGG